MIGKVSVERLRKTCDLRMLDCATSQDVKPLEAIIGQERAVRSLQFGLGIKEPGFNIYVAGMSGTGRTTAVKRFLEEVAREKPVPGDLCYVNNFHDPYRPKALCLPPGQAKELQEDVKGLVEGARREIRSAFESDEYGAKREETVKAFQQQRNEIFARINERAQKEGFLIQATPVGLLTIPLKEGKPLSDEEFQSLSPEKGEEISRKRERLQDDLKTAIRQARGLEKGINEALEELDREVALYALGHLVEDLKEKYQDIPEVLAYLDDVRDDILESLSQFREEFQAQPSPPFPMPGTRELPFRKYGVNVLVDNSELEGAPVVIELNPTYNNLFGRIEKEAQFGALVTDFTMIRVVLFTGPMVATWSFPPRSCCAIYSPGIA